MCEWYQHSSVWQCQDDVKSLCCSCSDLSLCLLCSNWYNTLTVFYSSLCNCGKIVTYCMLNHNTETYSIYSTFLWKILTTVTTDSPRGRILCIYRTVLNIMSYLLSVRSEAHRENRCCKRGFKNHCSGNSTRNSRNQKLLHRKVLGKIKVILKRVLVEVCKLDVAASN